MYSLYALQFNVAGGRRSADEGQRAPRIYHGQCLRHRGQNLVDVTNRAICMTASSGPHNGGERIAIRRPLVRIAFTAGDERRGAAGRGG